MLQDYMEYLILRAREERAFTQVSPDTRNKRSPFVLVFVHGIALLLSVAKRFQETSCRPTVKQRDAVIFKI